MLDTCGSIITTQRVREARDVPDRDDVVAALHTESAVAKHAVRQVESRRREPLHIRGPTDGLDDDVCREAASVRERETISPVWSSRRSASAVRRPPIPAPATTTRRSRIIRRA